jgi:NADH dehydrogenase
MVVHFNQILLYPLSYQFNNMLTLLSSIREEKPKEKIYVIGNGWGSYYFVKYLDKNKFHPIIIAPNEKVLNTPKLVERVFNPNALVEFENPHAEKIIDQLEEIDYKQKVLITKSGTIYPYSKVVLSIGSEPNDFGIQGVNQYTYKFKTIQDADNLRNKINKSSINSMIYMIGSGVTGIELTSKIDSLKLFNVKIIEGMDSILPGFNSKSKKEITNNLNKSNLIDLHLSNMVKLIDDKQVYTTNKSKEDVSFKYDLKQDIIVWTGGVRFNGYNKTSLFHSLNKITPNPIKPRGLEVNPDFSFGTNPLLGIYCIGDMVANMGPPSAQNAKNQGIWLAGYFNSGFDSEYLKSKSYKIESKGKLVHLNNKLYLESEYYTGYIPKIIDKIIEWIDSIN